jgi:hypothetical protein
MGDTKLDCAKLPSNIDNEGNAIIHNIWGSTKTWKEALQLLTTHIATQRNEKINHKDERNGNT